MNYMDIGSQHPVSIINDRSLHQKKWKVGMAVCGSIIQQQESELQSSNPLPITNITKLRANMVMGKGLLDYKVHSLVAELF